MLNKITEYKDRDTIKHLNELGKICTKYRGVRGDGNCFYRAITF